MSCVSKWFRKSFLLSSCYGNKNILYCSFCANKQICDFLTLKTLIEFENLIKGCHSFLEFYIWMFCKLLLPWKPYKILIDTISSCYEYLYNANISMQYHHISFIVLIFQLEYLFWESLIKYGRIDIFLLIRILQIKNYWKQSPKC